MCGRRDVLVAPSQAQHLGTRTILHSTRWRRRHSHRSSTDSHDPTAVRASQRGARSDWCASLEQFAAWKQQHGYAVVGTSPAATRDYHEFRYPHPVVVLMGSERIGLTEKSASCAMRWCASP
jgi:tRNA(Leu) C34 or U34 (ribose-2'-O)-methylase TrmL